MYVLSKQLIKGVNMHFSTHGFMDHILLWHVYILFLMHKLPYNFHYRFPEFSCFLFQSQLLCQLFNFDLTSDHTYHTIILSYDCMSTLFFFTVLVIHCCYWNLFIWCYSLFYNLIWLAFEFVICTYLFLIKEHRQTTVHTTQRRFFRN